jgi:hypothetical protein
MPNSCPKLLPLQGSDSRPLKVFALSLGWPVGPEPLWAATGAPQDLVHLYTAE